MFERFTDKARRVVVLAQEESRLMNHNYIGTEHILLGLLHEGEGVGAKALESMDISLDAVRQQVEKMIGQGETAPTAHIPFTPRAKKVLELSLRESKQLGHNYIGTEHILLGLIREGEGVAAQVLEKLGADPNKVRQQVVKLLSGFTGPERAWEQVPPGEETVTLGVRQGEAADAPLCPRCRAQLKDTAAYRVLDVPGPEGESSRSVPYVFCQRCGTWLGTIPPA
jgi:ATP-dependent Clp protease ATP-binding subunit ClpC